MKAIIKTKPGLSFTLAEIAEPTLTKSTDVKIKMIYSSICGTDVHIYKWDDWAKTNIKPPHINGHEGVGQVVEVGSNVFNIKIGDFVAYETHYYCGKCHVCKQGHTNVCKKMTILGVNIDGVWRETTIVPAKLLFKIPSKTNVPIKYCGILEPFGNAHHTLSYSNLENKNVLIMGDGPIGIFAAMIAQVYHPRKVILSGRSKIRMNIAQKNGIEVIDQKSFNSKKAYDDKLLKLTNDEGIDVIAELTGNPNAFNDAVRVINPGGDINVLSIYSKNNFPIEINQLVFKNIAMHFICGRKIFKTWEKSFELINSGQIKLSQIDNIITHEYDLVDFEKGFKQIIAKKAGKVLLKINPQLVENK